jgi:VIT1/CCC1 family predicted Fe2+/Mn2+ transporter
MTAHKAVAAFITSLIALIGVFGISTGWASPTLIDGISAVIGAVLTAVVTYMVPNQPKV